RDTSPEHRATVSRPVAVIDIGTTSIRMEVAEISNDGSVRTLQQLFQAVNLGKDTFTTGSLQKNTIEKCVRILKSYRQVLNEFQITKDDQIRIVATSSVREADNRLTFLDRIYSATGFQIEPIEEPDVVRITYLGIQPFLRVESALSDRRSLIVEVGGGSTELLLVQGEDVLASHTYRLGTVRLWESLNRMQSTHLPGREIMADRINQMVDQIQHQLGKEGVDQMVALGGDMRFAASHLLEDWTPDELGRLPLKDLDRFADLILHQTFDQIVRKYRLSYDDAATLGPALLVNQTIANRLGLDHLLVTRFSLRDGLLK
ncbi:MAG TPA: exopolyphosphatase, partial [Planctomycetaceae bacterium]|nr:exopolyphosphatase [Planctomycetaceae bacterium]